MRDFYDAEPEPQDARQRVIDGFKALAATLEAKTDREAAIARHRAAIAKGNEFWDQRRADLDRQREAERTSGP